MSGKKKSRSSGDQFKLRFPQPDLRFEDLAVSACNRVAISALRRWRDWSSPVMCLMGPARSGLTTAAKAWVLDTDGVYYGGSAFSRLGHAMVDELAHRPIAIDWAEKIASEDNLLSLINLSARYGGKVLLTSQTSPATWKRKSADLTSRLKSMPILAFAQPDEIMAGLRLRAAARRYFLKLPDEVVSYLLHRAELSYAAIEDIMTELDRIVGDQEITVHLLREVLEMRIGTGELFDDKDAQ